MSKPVVSELVPLPSSQGEWLLPLLGTWGTVASVVGDGWESYAVIPHRLHVAGEAPPDRLDDELVAALRGALTRDPAAQALAPAEVARRYVVGFWEGHGGLLSGSVLFDVDTGRSRQVPPALAPEIEGLPRLATPHRGHLLFRAALDGFGEYALGRGGAGTVFPDLFWPDDHAWLVGTDTDLVATFVAGPTAVVNRVLEGVPGSAVVTPDQLLTEWDEYLLSGGAE